MDRGAQDRLGNRSSSPGWNRNRPGTSEYARGRNNSEGLADPGPGLLRNVATPDYGLQTGLNPVGIAHAGGGMVARGGRLRRARSVDRTTTYVHDGDHFHQPRRNQIPHMHSLQEWFGPGGWCARRVAGGGWWVGNGGAEIWWPGIGGVGSVGQPWCSGRDRAANSPQPSRQTIRLPTAYLVEVASLSPGLPPQRLPGVCDPQDELNPESCSFRRGFAQ